MGRWIKKDIGELGTLKGGSGFKKKYQGKKGLKYPFYKVSDFTIEGNEIYLSSSNHTIDEKIRRVLNVNIFPENTIVFAKVGAALLLNRRRILTKESAIDNNTMGFIPNEKLIDPNFAYYFFKNIDFADFVNKGAIPSVNQKQISSITIFYPESIPEQRRIVSKLDVLFAKIDASLTLIDQNIAQAEALKLSVLDEEFAVESGELKIKDLIEKTKNLKPKRIYKDEEFTYIDISSLNKDLKIIDNPKFLKGVDAPSRAKREVKLGDIVFATTRPNLKNIAIVEKEYKNPIASTGFCVLRTKKDKVINRYLFYFLISNKTQDLIQPFIRGAQYPAISDSNLKEIELPVPSIKEQKLIVQKLDALFMEIDALIKDYTQKRENLEALKSSLLDQAFKGEL